MSPGPRGALPVDSSISQKGEIAAQATEPREGLGELRVQTASRRAERHGARSRRGTAAEGRPGGFFASLGTEARTASIAGVGDLQGVPPFSTWSRQVRVDLVEHRVEGVADIGGSYRRSGSSGGCRPGGSTRFGLVSTCASNSSRISLPRSSFGFREITAPSDPSLPASYEASCLSPSREALDWMTPSTTEPNRGGWI